MPNAYPCAGRTCANAFDSNRVDYRDVRARVADPIAPGGVEVYESPRFGDSAPFILWHVKKSGGLKRRPDGTGIDHYIGEISYDELELDAPNYKQGWAAYYGGCRPTLHDNAEDAMAWLLREARI